MYDFILALGIARSSKAVQYTPSDHSVCDNTFLTGAVHIAKDAIIYGYFSQSRCIYVGQTKQTLHLNYVIDLNLISIMPY